MKLLLLTLALLAFVCGCSALNCAVSSRSDCGYEGIDAAQCGDRGCCWNPQPNVPWCFYPITTPPVYSVSNFSKGENGFTAFLTLTNPGAGSHGPALSELELTAAFETDSRVHFRITDPNNQRYEIPQSVLPFPSLGSKRMPFPGKEGSYDFNGGQYVVNVAPEGETLTLNVVRNVDGAVIFDLADLEYSNQFLQLSSLTPEANPLLYGLGEHVDPFQLPTDDHSFTMWDVDIPTPYDQNIYGSHPFYLETLSKTGLAHGLFMRSSNGMDVITSSDRVTFKIIGGILDFYVFVGPTHEQVIQQYHGVIGFPHFPPYWSLGWHQCKYGWKSIQEVETVVATYAQHQIPLDTIWGDIDYMDSYEDFSWDPTNYPLNQVKQFADQLHSNGQHYVVIVDPGIHNRTGYQPFDEGLQQNIFVKTGDGVTPYIGKVWPGYTAFPDFLNSNTSAYWSNQISNFLSGVSYDGLWIDMNEISNFIDGEPYNGDAAVNNPPYAINNFNSRSPLNTRTLPMDALHNNGEYQEYDVHNLFGLTEAIATRQALESIQGVRSFVLSRSTFPSIGVHSAHWLGDNHATYDDLYRSIPGILNMNMYGVPLVGADICGFINPTTEELCGRWTALGAFYPFSRNHHEPEENQEPYLWPSVEAVAKKVLAMRYSLLPTLYTLFWNVHSNGGTVARSLMFNFPTDSNTYAIDKQFMWGDILLVTPVLTQGATSVTGYFPPSAIWYSMWNLSILEPSSSGYQTLPCAVSDAIQLHVAGGSLLTMQSPAMTTAATRQNPFSLTIALDGNGQAKGNFFWDSGADLQDNTNALYVSLTTDVTNGIASTVVSNTFQGTLPALTSFQIGGFTHNPSSVLVNGSPLAAGAWSYSAVTKVFSASGFTAQLNQPLSITWGSSSMEDTPLIALE